MFGVRDGESPYRETHESYLPRFGPDAGLRGVESTVAADAGPPPAAGQETARDGGVAPGPALSTPPPPVAPPARTNHRWWLKLAGLWRGGRSEAATRLPPMTRRQVQGELSLDDVKVIRNDLKDADVAVVPFRSSTVRHERLEHLSLRRDSTGAAATFLGRATGRLFGTR